MKRLQPCSCTFRDYYSSCFVGLNAATCSENTFPRVIVPHTFWNLLSKCVSQHLLYKLYIYIKKNHTICVEFVIPGPPLQRQHSQRTDPRTAHHNQRTGQHVPSQVNPTASARPAHNSCQRRLTSSVQLYSEPAQQQDRERGPPPQPPHQVRRVHQELSPGRVLGSGGAGAALLSLLLGGVL